MLKQQSVLFSFSGFTQSGKTSIYQEVQRLFEKRRSLEQPLLFLGNVLANLPHTDESHATTRLLRGWANLNEACVTRVGPALKAGHAVVVDGFGLDVYLRAVHCHDCPEQIEQAFHLHHEHLVPARIITQGIRPPIYLLPRKRHPHTSVVEMLHTREELEIARYFDNTGQNPPLWLEGATVQDQAEEALEMILARCLPEAAVA